MAILLRTSINFPSLSSSNTDSPTKPFFHFSLLSTKITSFCPRPLKLRAFVERGFFLQPCRGKEGILFKDERCKRKKRVVGVRSNKGFGFSGGGGGGRRDTGATARLVGNIALAIGLAYLSMTGQLGWVLDAIVSIWLLIVLVPIIGFGAFLLWAGRDIVQGACPNCGNEFQIFKSTVNDELQFCPFCSQPFSVVGDKFVRDPVKFSNQEKAYGSAFNDFSSYSKKEKVPSKAVLDIEAEIKDAE